MKRRFIIVAILFVIGILHGFAYDFEVDGIYYKKDAGGETVSVTWKTYKDGRIYSGDVTIPKKVAYGGKEYTVTGIDEYAFYECNITSVSLPNTITHIDKLAFRGCGLTSIKLPNRLVSIGENAFGMCKIVSFELPNTLETIGKYAFMQNTDLATISIPSSVTEIGGDAFRGCTNLSLTLPATDIAVSEGAFYRVKEVHVTNIDSWMKIASSNRVFTYVDTGSYSSGSTTQWPHIYDSNGDIVTDYVIPEGITSIGYQHFYNNTDIISLKTPQSLKKIDDSAFFGCSNLTTLELNGVEEICQRAFKANASLQTVKFGSSIKTIQKDAFAGCEKITSVDIGDLANWCEVSFQWGDPYSTGDAATGILDDGTVNSNPLRYSHVIIVDGQQLDELIIPSGVTAISDCAFAGCLYFDKVVIPKTVRSIGMYAFANCSHIDNLSFASGSTLESIGNYAFKACALSSVSLPNTLQTLGGAFMNCSQLRTVNIPAGVTAIADKTFYGCSSLEGIVIPDGVKSIGSGAFRYCNNEKFNSIAIPSSVETIGSEAFDGCDKLTGVFITDLAAWCNIDFEFTSAYGLNDYNTGFHIPGNPLYHAHKLYLNNELITDLVIPNGVKNVKQYTFIENTALNTITIPEGVETIGTGAFIFSNNVNKVYLPATLTEIGARAFERMLTATDNELHIKSIENWAKNALGYGFDATGQLNVYLNGRLLKNLVIPESVTVIPAKGSGSGLGAFSRWAIETVTLPSKLQELHCIAFSGCNSLTSIYSKAKFVPKLVNWSGKTQTQLYGAVASELPALTAIYVPVGKATSYKQSWSAHADIVQETDTWPYDEQEVESGGVSLDQTEVIVRKNKSVTLKATVYPETLADKSVKWKSSDKTIATVSSSGKVTGVKSGFVTITCTSVATGAKATCKVTVGTITLNKKEVIVRKKKSVTLTPTVYPTTLEDKSVTWKSSDKSIATVSSSGKVTGVKSGVVTITCTSNATGLSATCKVTVATIALNKKEAIVRKKKTLTLTPTVYPTTLEDKSVTWKSSDESVATVSSDGVVTGIKSGVVTITCTSNATGVSTTCTVTVGTITLNMSSVTITKGESVTLKPTVYPTTLEDKSVTWKSSKTSVATVSSTGKVTGVKAGTATITCTSNATGLSTTCKVTVTASASARTIDGDDAELTDIEIVEVTPAVVEPFDVYDLRGHRVLHQVTSLNGLPAGVYIVKGKIVMKK